MAIQCTIFFAERGGALVGVLPLGQARHLFYWEVMRRAAEAGVKECDYGRSKKGTGSFADETH
jgi:hypothetical protein